MQFNWNDPTAIMFAIYLVDRKSTRLNSSHLVISYAVFCLKKKKKRIQLAWARRKYSHSSLPTSTHVSKRTFITAHVMSSGDIHAVVVPGQPQPSSWTNDNL